MKKLGMLALAVLMVAAVTIPAWAMESEFGGYWRTRFWTRANFTGEDDSEALDVSAVDTRTRLYYTAIFHENLKFVNKFEFDAAWGTDSSKGVQGYGDIGADGVNIEIKNSYVDFNLGPVNTKVGVQGAVLGRGFLFDDDFAGLVINFKGDNFGIPLIWMKAWEGGMGKDKNEFDVDYYGIAPYFTLMGNQMKINPYFVYVYSDDATNWGNSGQVSLLDPLYNATVLQPLKDIEELNLWYAGLDFDMAIDAFTLWFTGIYMGGDGDIINTDLSVDFEAYLLDLGFKWNFGVGDLHMESFYATGDDNKSDQDWERFWVPRGQSHYWAEIMGYGILGDTEYAALNPGWTGDFRIGNIWAANLGANFKPMEDLNLRLDVWYAQTVEDMLTLMGNNDNYLGTEIDLVITYQLVKGLNLDLVGAYLIAGDATTLENPNDADPYEVGARLSLSF